MSEKNEVNISDISNIQNNTVALDFIDGKIEKIQEELESERRSLKAFKVLSVFIIVFGILILTPVFNWPKFIGWFLILLGVIIYIGCFSESKTGQLKAEIKTLKNQKSRLDKNIGNETSKYFDSLVSINLRNLEEYYDLVKHSNKKSFYASLVISIIGVILIIAAIAVSYFTPAFKDITYIVTAAGVIVEAVSALLFYLYNKTVLQLKSYHDSLIHVQNALLSFKLVEDIKDEKIKSDIIKQMIDNLVQRK